MLEVNLRLVMSIFLLTIKIKRAQKHATINLFLVSLLICAKFHVFNFSYSSFLTNSQCPRMEEEKMRLKKTSMDFHY